MGMDFKELRDPSFDRSKDVDKLIYLSGVYNYYGTILDREAEDQLEIKTEILNLKPFMGMPSWTHVILDTIQFEQFDYPVITKSSFNTKFLEICKVVEGVSNVSNP